MMTTDKCLYCGGELNTARACVNPDCESKKLRAYPMPDATSRHTWTACIPPCQQLTDLAARLDEAEKRIEELELATPCPMLKSICEGWEFTVKLDKEEIIERYAGEIHTIRALDSVQLDTVKQLLSDLIDEVTK